MVTVGPLIGRESELTQLEVLLDRTRLVTVTGAGGCGKTRLALELADRVSSNEDGPECVIAPLSSVASEQQLVDALLAAVGARERFGSYPRRVLLDHVASRRLLLVLNNCEHIVAEVGRLAGELLDGAPDGRLLATSREPLAMETLAGKGLIMPVPAHGHERWAFLQTVAEYAAEQLARAGEWEEIAERHLAHFLAYSAHADTLLLEPDGHERIEQETPNLRRASERAIEHDRSGALRIAASLMRHWILAEHYQEAGSVSAAALAAASGDGDAAARTVVHCGAGLVTMLSEDYTAAIEHTRVGLELLGDVKDASAQSTPGSSIDADL